MQVRDNILRGAFEFEPVDIWQTVSQEAKDFIKSLLVIDPMDRPTARQAKESKWIQMWSNRENNGEGTVINPNVVKALVGFKEYSDMRKLLCEVLSFTLLPDQIQDLRKEFEKYDQEGTGEITLSTLKKVLIGNASTGSLGTSIIPFPLIISLYSASFNLIVSLLQFYHPQGDLPRKK